MELADKYVYEVYKEHSFSKAAKKLFISQSSLSSTVKKLEHKLGILIFDRSKSPIALSREGKVYIEYLEELIESEKNMHTRIKSLSKPIYDQVSIGNAFFISRYLLPKVCKRFKEELPEVELKLYMGESKLYADLFDKLDAGLLQLIIGFKFDEKRYTGIPLLEERYVISIRNDYPGVDRLKKYALTYNEILSGKDFPKKIISDYSLFSNIEFLKINSTGILWQDMAKFLMHCPITSPQIYDCRNIDVIYDMMLSGLGAAITTDTVISYHPKNDDISYFLIKTPTPLRQAYIIHKKDIPLSETAKAFIDILLKTIKETKSN